MNILEKIRSSITYFDGGMGTLLQARGLKPGELPERWGMEHADMVIDIHSRYLEAGCNIIMTNSFGANIVKYSLAELKKIIPASIDNARAAVKNFSGDRYVAFDVGPTGKLLRPLGELDFEDAVDIFSKSIRIAADCEPDLIIIETMNDSYEVKAAVLAAKENSDLPVFVTTVYDERGKLMTGADPAAMVALLEGLGIQRRRRAFCRHHGGDCQSRCRHHRRLLRHHAGIHAKGDRKDLPPAFYATNAKK